jgi:hypothetical protein
MACFMCFSEMAEITTLDAVPVKSLYYDGHAVNVKLADGAWGMCDDPDTSFLASFSAPSDLEVKVGRGTFVTSFVSGFLVLQPLLRLEGEHQNTSAQGSELSRLVKGLTEALGGRRSRRRSRSRSRSSDSGSEDALVLPAALRDVVLSHKVAKRLTGRRFAEVQLEQLLDARDLALQDGKKGAGLITTSDRLVKALLVLVRYRVAYYPGETADLLKFLFRVQDVVGAYSFEVVHSAVKRHLRSVAAGRGWGDELVLGRVDQRDHLPVCPGCKIHHLKEACGWKEASPVMRRPSPRLPFSELTCFKCGVKGHLAKSCVQQPRGMVSLPYRMPPKVGASATRYGVQKGAD